MVEAASGLRSSADPQAVLELALAAAMLCDFDRPHLAVRLASSCEVEDDETVPTSDLVQILILNRGWMCAVVEETKGLHHCGV